LKIIELSKIEKYSMSKQFIDILLDKYNNELVIREFTLKFRDFDN
jgi:hypothetical protein